MSIRVFHIIPSLISGGAERQLVSLVSHTSAEFSHFVCAFSDSEFFGDEIRQAGQEIYDLGINGKHPWFSAARKTLKLISEVKPDVIVTWLFDANIVGRLIKANSPRLPLITTLHSADYDAETIRAGGWSPRKVNGLKQIDKWTAKAARPQFVAVSQAVKNSYVKELKIPENQIKVIYNGIDPASLNCAANARENMRRELKIPEKAFVYLTVGRLDAPKNHQLIIRALPQILPAVPHAHLVIVGTGPSENDLKDLANALGVGERVHFTGRRREIGAFLEMSDTFVFPTLVEGFGIALVEAMFKKLPCLASNLEVFKEIIDDGENGLLFKTDDVNSPATAMIKAASEIDLRNKLAEAAFRNVSQRFHIRTTIKEWEDFLRKTVK